MPGSYLDGLLAVEVESAGTIVSKAGGAFGGGLNFTAPLTAVPNAANPNVADIGFSGAPVLGDVTVNSVTLVGQPAPFISGPYKLVTTDATAHTIASIAIPVASTLDAEVRCVAILGTGVNANDRPAVYRLEITGVRVGSGAATSGGDDNRSSVSAPFVSPQGSGTPTAGSPNIVASGNNMLFQVVGFTIKEAWTSGHAYVTGDGNVVPGDFVTSNGGVWVCTTSGTAGGSAPSGTGTGVGTGAKFDYVGPASGSSVTVSWTMVITGLVGGA